MSYIGECYYKVCVATGIYICVNCGGDTAAKQRFCDGKCEKEFKEANQCKN